MCSVCSVVKKNGIATQPQDHLPDGVGLLHQLVDHFVYEMPSELDTLLDRRRGHPSGFELLVKLFRVPRSDLGEYGPKAKTRSPVRFERFETRQSIYSRLSWD